MTTELDADTHNDNWLPRDMAASQPSDTEDVAQEEAVMQRKMKPSGKSVTDHCQVLCMLLSSLQFYFLLQFLFLSILMFTLGISPYQNKGGWCKRAWMCWKCAFLGLVYLKSKWPVSWVILVVQRVTSPAGMWCKQRSFKLCNDFFVSVWLYLALP